jgi:hypothetical protein
MTDFETKVLQRLQAILILLASLWVLGVFILIGLAVSAHGQEKSPTAKLGHTPSPPERLRTFPGIPEPVN